MESSTYYVCFAIHFILVHIEFFRSFIKIPEDFIHKMLVRKPAPFITEKNPLEIFNAVVSYMSSLIHSFIKGFAV